MPRIQTVLEALDGTLSQKRRKYYARLTPSKGDETISLIRSTLAPVPVPECIETFYRWKDGEARSLGLKPGYFFLNSSGLCGVYEKNRDDITRYGFPSLFRWLIPVFYTDSRLDIAVVAYPNAKLEGHVVAIDGESQSIYLLSHNLSNFLSIIQQGWEENIYRENSSAEGSPFEYSLAELVIVRRVDGNEVLPRVQLGITKFDFEAREFWPCSWQALS
ncbi:MAG: hypothetical protein SF172_09730 [Burkholderiales bacterium]|nr:hypothetical protein [Burkholderiales bacterium]